MPTPIWMLSATSAIAGKLKTSQSPEELDRNPERSSMCTRCITTMTAPVSLLSRRDIKVLDTHWLRVLRRASDCASAGFCGSSMINRSPPRPVSGPETDVDFRKPRLVVISSPSTLRDIRIFGKARLYQEECTMDLKSLACLADRSSP